jgi:hypothetical protein
LSWFVWLAARSPGGFVELARRELFESVFRGDLRRSGPFWMPAGVLAAGALPWGLWLLPHVATARRAVASSASARLLAGWGAGGLLVFTLSRSRMPLYVLPLAVTIAAPAGVCVAHWIRESQRRRAGAIALALALAATLLVVRAEAHRISRYRHSEQLAAEVRSRQAHLGDPVILLQNHFLPGLAFALQQKLVTVAMNPAELEAPHDAMWTDLPNLIAAHPGGVVAVGRPERFGELPPEIRATASTQDPASSLAVARLHRP